MMQIGMITEWCPCAGIGEGQRGGEGSGRMPPYFICICSHGSSQANIHLKN